MAPSAAITAEAPYATGGVAGGRGALDRDLLHALHLWLINRGALIAPFHNLMLVSPVTEDAQTDRLAKTVDGSAAALPGGAA